jgi:hypothetical protein
LTLLPCICRPLLAKSDLRREKAAQSRIAEIPFGSSHRLQGLDFKMPQERQQAASLASTLPRFSSRRDSLLSLTTQELNANMTCSSISILRATFARSQTSLFKKACCPSMLALPVIKKQLIQWVSRKWWPSPTSFFTPRPTCILSPSARCERGTQSWSIEAARLLKCTGPRSGSKCSSVGCSRQTNQELKGLPASAAASR